MDVAVGVAVGDGVGVSVGAGDGELVAVGVGVGDGELVVVSVGAGVDVAEGVDVADGGRVAVRLAVIVAVEVTVRLGVGVAVAVAGSRSASTNVPRDGVIPQIVPCVESRSVRIWLVSGVQLPLWRRSSATAAGWAKLAASNSTQSCLLPAGFSEFATEKNHAVAEAYSGGTGASAAPSSRAPLVVSAEGASL